MRGKSSTYSRGYIDGVSVFIAAAWMALWLLWPAPGVVSLRPDGLPAPAVSCLPFNLPDHKQPYPAVQSSGNGGKAGEPDLNGLQQAPASQRTVTPRFLEWGALFVNAPAVTNPVSPSEGLSCQLTVYQPQFEAEHVFGRKNGQGKSVLIRASDELEARKFEVPEFPVESVKGFEKPWQVDVRVEVGENGRGEHSCRQDDFHGQGKRTGNKMLRTRDGEFRKTMRPRIVNWTSGKKNGTVETFLERPAFDRSVEQTVRRVLADIRTGGDRAVLTYVRRFDGVSLGKDDLRVGRRELADARRGVDGKFRAAAREAYRRIAAFAKAGMRKDWRMRSPRGGTLGEQFMPLDRVGVYVPGGAAPLASTALMTVTLAKVAGVKEIVACTPCGRDGKMNPFLLYSLEVAGATEIYKVGGIQAVGLMAYGTETIRKVQKIAGPGGTYVTAAKRQVYGDVALDLVAGPSEIAVLADDAADARCVAADLLSQAEHGTGWEKALLATPSAALARAVAVEIRRQTASLSRRAAIRKVINRGMLLVVVRNMNDGMNLCNRFAPEHLEIMARKPRQLLKKVRCAGAIFLGKWTPESAGDFAAGPSHVLPTGGAARMFSGLTVDDFRRRSSVIEFTRSDLQAALPVIETFGRIEGLDAHARSAAIRFGTV